MSDDYLKTIEQTFEQQFALQGVRAEFSQFVPLQVNLKITVPVEPTPPQEALGRAIEAEHAELDQMVWVEVLRDRGEELVQVALEGDIQAPG